MLRLPCRLPSSRRICWRPSIHMPREAAWLFLGYGGAEWNGCRTSQKSRPSWKASSWTVQILFDITVRRKECNMPSRGWNTARECFLWGVWNSTVKPRRPTLYGWGGQTLRYG